MKQSTFLWILTLGFGMIFLISDAVADAPRASYDAHGKRDPFIPLITRGSSAGTGLLGVESIEDIVVEGIVYDPRKGSIVIANGAVLKEGQKQGFVRVVEVRPKGAVFSIHGIEAYKPLFEEHSAE